MNNSSWGLKLSLFGISAFSGLILSGVAFNTTVFANEERANSTINYKIKIKHEAYLIHFNVCSGIQSLEKPTIYIITDKELKQINYKKILSAGTCKSFESIVNSKYPSNIIILIN